MRRDALVVGINKYPFLKDTSTSPAKHLTTPAADAEAIAQRLEDYGGFRVKRLPEGKIDGKLQVDPDPKKAVKTEELEAAILDLFLPKTEKPPETALLFFAGHGLRKQLGHLTQGFLAAGDVKPGEKWGFRLGDLWDILQQSQVKQQIIWLDCCFSGELLNFQDTELKSHSSRYDRFLIAASCDYEVAYQQLDGEHGVLSRALIEGLDPNKIPQGDWITDRKLKEFVERRLDIYYKQTKIPQTPLIRSPDQPINLILGKGQESLKNLPDAKKSTEREPPSRFHRVERNTLKGRDEELKKLEELLLNSQDTKTSNIAALVGIGGIGKTTLANCFATLHKEDFPDGVINLRVDVYKDEKTIACKLARICGEEADPEDERDAPTIMEDLFANRRMLLIFDNVDNSSIKLKQLYENINCAVIITTRDRSIPLSIDISETAIINLAGLPEEKALELLGELIDKNRLEREPQAAQNLIKFAHGLPLALQIIGKQLALYKQTSLANHAKRLIAQSKRVKLSDANDWDLFACFSVSLEYLEPEEKNFFACLSVCAKDGFSFRTAMAATDCHESNTVNYLDRLYELSLINYSDMGEDRYAFHPLIYLFASELSVERNLKDNAEERHAQLYIRLIKSIDNHNYSTISVLSQDANDIILATKWLLKKEILDCEFTENLNTFFEEENTHNNDASELMSDFQSLATKIEDWENFIIFCTRRAKFLVFQGELLQAESALQCIPDILLKIASSNDRECLKVRYLVRLGNVLQLQGRFHEAHENLQNSIAISQQMGEQTLLRNAKATLVHILRQQNLHKEALKLSEEVVNISEEIGDKSSLVKDLYNLAISLQKLGRNQEAVEKIKLSIEISKDSVSHKQLILIRSLRLLINLQGRLGRLEEALAATEEIAEISKTLNYKARSKTTAINSFWKGGILQKQGKLSEAFQAYLYAFEFRNLFKDQKPLLGEFRTLGGLLQERGMLNEAKKAFECVIDISKEFDDKKTLASGLNLLGHILKEQGELKKAEQCFLDQIEIGKILENRGQIIVGLNSLVEISLKIGNLDEALQAFLERIEISSEKELFYVTISRLAKYLQEQEGRLEELLQAFQRKIELYESQNDQQKLDDLFSILGSSLKEQNKLEAALQALKSKIETDKFLYIKPSTSMMLNRLGRLLQEQGNLEKAYDAYQTQIEISEHLHDKQQLASGLYFLGKLQKEEFNFEDAKNNLERCVEIRKNSRDWEQYVIELLTLGEILIEMGELNKAEDIFRESVANCKTNNYQNTLANGLHKLGHLLKDQEKIDQAIEVFKEQTEISETLENKKLLVHGLMRLGELYQENKQLSEALQAFLNAANYCEMLNDHSTLFFRLKKSGEMLQKKGEIEQAKLAFLSIVKIGETFDHCETLANGHNLIGKIFQKEGDFEKAQQAFKSQIEIGQGYYKLIPIVRGIEDLYNINGLNIWLKQKFYEAIQALKQVIDINDSPYEKSELFTEILDISKLFEESLQKLQEVIQLDEIINSELNIANVLSSIIEKKLFEIRETLGKSFNLVDKSKDKYGQAIVCYIAGALLQKHQYKFEEKLKSLPDYFNKSIQIAEELGETEHLAKVYISKGQYLVSRGETEKAVEEMCKSFIHYEKLQNSFGLGIVTPLLIFSLIKIGRLHDATDYCQRALKVDSNQKSLQKLSELLSSKIIFTVGSVKYIDQNKKYGYIATDNGSPDIRFYNKVNLSKGNLVEVVSKQDSKAIDAHIIRIITK